MKKYIFTLGFLAVFGMANAQKFSVADVEVMQGGTVNVALTIDTESAGDYTGFQFEAYVPEGFTTTGASTVDNNTWDKAKNSGTLDVGDVLVDNGRYARFLATSKDVVIPAGEFQVATFELKVAETVELGTYDVTIKNFAFLIQTGGKASVAELKFKVNVVDYMTLSEDATVAPKAATGVKVKVKRTIAANTWSTICLPFAMSEAQVKDAFGDKVVLGDFDDYNLVEEGKDIVGITVKFKSVTAIEANHPYIIKASKAVTEFNVENVNVAPSENLEINLGTSRRPHSIIGNYIAESKIENGGLFLNGGKFYYSIGDTKIKGFRAYFNFDDLLTEFENEYAASRINITFDDVTAIKGIKTDGEEEIYTLSGQRVKNASKGVYIVNGKKVIKK